LKENKKSNNKRCIQKQQQQQSYEYEPRNSMRQHVNAAQNENEKEIPKAAPDEAYP